MSEFDICYSSRPAIKAQVLADFVVECEVAGRDDGDQAKVARPWTLHVDGSYTASRSEARLSLSNPDGAVWRYALRFGFHASNNEAEYEALLAGLRLAKEIGADDVRAFSDSQLVVNQLKGEYEAKEPAMVRYLEKAREAISALKNFEVERIPKSENSEADALAKLASSEFTDLKGSIFVEVLPGLSMEVEPVPVVPVAKEPYWMDPIVNFI